MTKDVYNHEIRVDMISDTATRPSAGMWEAMRRAPLGDEQKREDPTVVELEARVAELLGKDTAIFLPSATMANQIALALFTAPGDEVLCHHSAHIRNHEAGYAAVLARVQLQVLSGERGHFDAGDIDEVVRDRSDAHYPHSSLVVIENTSNGGGGSPWPMDKFDRVVDSARRNDLRVHIDGARIMNASVATGEKPSAYGHKADSVQMCFSKGLGCPFGAMLAVDSAQESRVRRWKQGLGGALRQAGVIAAAMSYALDHNIDALVQDHKNARRLADGLRALGLEVEPVETNLVYFHAADAAAFCQAWLARGIRAAPVGATRMRACLHLDVSAADVERALTAAKDFIPQPPTAKKEQS